jgi:hypothetical protein
MTFHYFTTNEAHNRTYPHRTPITTPIPVFRLPLTLVWGLLPLGWHHLGHTADHDYWRLPGDTRGLYQLRIARTLEDFGTTELLVANGGTGQAIGSIHWSLTFHTRAELDEALLGLHEIAKDFETLRVFGALNRTHT